MKCETVQNLLDDYVDGLLIGEEPALVARHLASCPDCARQANTLREMLQKAKALSQTTILPLDDESLDNRVEIRQLKIDALVKGGNITPAAATKLAEKYCNREAIALAHTSGTRDDFKDVIAILKDNIAISLSETTGAQILPGGEGDGGTKITALEREAEARAKAAQA